MKNKNFFLTKAGGLTIAFLVIMISFLVIRVGLGSENDVVCLIGFLMIIVAMLYAPIKVFLIDRNKKK